MASERQKETRVIVIDKCEQCPMSECNIRVLCGGIPQECDLAKPGESGSRREYDKEHQLRAYQAVVRDAKAFDKLRYGGGE